MKKNQLAEIFVNNGVSLRVVGTSENPMFVAADICAALEIQDVSNAVKNLDPDEKGTCLIRTLGGSQKMLCVTEAGLYTVILRSDKPKAKVFTRWVTHEVIPSIRKTGTYHIQDAVARQKLASEFQMPMIALKEMRALVGKETQSFHYANEAKLINWAMTGNFAPLDRDALPLVNKQYLTALQQRDFQLLIQGRTWEERKEMLNDYYRVISSVQLEKGTSQIGTLEDAQ